MVKVSVDWTQGNAVLAPPITAIQRSHTSNFIEKQSETHDHLLGAHSGPKLMYSSITSDFPLKLLFKILLRRKIYTAFQKKTTPLIFLNNT